MRMWLQPSFQSWSINLTLSQKLSSVLQMLTRPCRAHDAMFAASKKWAMTLCTFEYECAWRTLQKNKFFTVHPKKVSHPIWEMMPIFLWYPTRITMSSVLFDATKALRGLNSVQAMTAGTERKTHKPNLSREQEFISPSRSRSIWSVTTVYDWCGMLTLFHVLRALAQSKAMCKFDCLGASAPNKSIFIHVDLPTLRRWHKRGVLVAADIRVSRSLNLYRSSSLVRFYWWCVDREPLPIFPHHRLIVIQVISL